MSVYWTPDEKAIFTQHAPDWMRQIVQLPDGGCTGASSSELCDGHALATAVYGDRLTPNSGLTAFAYLWRRFGPPWWGSDDHKDLVGYMLGTPHSEIWLHLHLSGSCLAYAVGYLITKTLHATCFEARRHWEQRFDAWWLAHHATPEEQHCVAAADALGAVGDTPERRAVLAPIAASYWAARWNEGVMAAAAHALGGSPARGDGTVIQVALTEALRELLRPVFIRDIAVNILGRVPDAALEHGVHCADRSPYAGYGIPQEAMAQQRAEEEEA